MPSYYENQSDNQARRKGAKFVKPSIIFIAIIFCALLAFEIFNFSTTELALSDLLGELSFLGFQWATILAIAFCAIDFAGIARLFTPETGGDEPKEVWYLFGAWLLAATMNALLTWWGVSMAVINHNPQSTAVVDPKTITGVVPVFVAVMVWVIRILIIGTLSLAIDRMIAPGRQKQAGPAPVSAPRQSPPRSQVDRPVSNPVTSAGMPSQRPMTTARPTQAAARSTRPSMPEPEYEDDPDLFPSRQRLEPSYHSLSARPQQNGSDSSRPHNFT